MPQWRLAWLQRRPLRRGGPPAEAASLPRAATRTAVGKLRAAAARGRGARFAWRGVAQARRRQRAHAAARVEVKGGAGVAVVAPPATAALEVEQGVQRRQRRHGARVVAAPLRGGTFAHAQVVGGKRRRRTRARSGAGRGGEGGGTDGAKRHSQLGHGSGAPAGPGPKGVGVRLPRVLARVDVRAPGVGRVRERKVAVDSDRKHHPRLGGGDWGAG